MERPGYVKEPACGTWKAAPLFSWGEPRNSMQNDGEEGEKENDRWH